MSMVDFLDKYFITPIYTDSGYNFVNSITYALIALLALYLIYKILQKLKLKINRNFFWAVLPFIFLGSSLRAFVDHKIYSIGFWTVSPGIYLLIAGIFLACLFTSIAIRKENYWKLCAAAGWVLLGINFILVWSELSWTNGVAAAAAIGIAVGISALLYLIFSKLKLKWCLKGCSFFPFLTHMLDASVTFIAVDFLGVLEKHPLPAVLTKWTGTAAIMFPLKLVILLPAVWLINTELKDKNAKNYLLIALAVLGLAEGLRDILTIILV